MSHGLSTPSAELAQYAAVLRRRARWVVLGLLLGVALAALAIAQLPRSYDSTASVLVNNIEGQSGSVEGGRTTSSLNLDTEAQIVTSTVVSRQAAGKLDFEVTPPALVRATQVSVPPNTSVLDITFSAASPTNAQAGATALAEAYLENRQQIADEALGRSTEQLQEQVKRLSAELQSVGKLLQRLPAGSARRAFAESRRQLLVNQIDALNQRASSQQTSDVAPGRIITDAAVPDSPTEPNVPIVGVGGALLGLLGGVLLAFVLDRRDRRVRDRQDLDRIGLDVLAPDFAVPPPGVVASPLDTRFHAESMRMLRNSLLAQLPGHRGSILVAAASPGALGSTVALNLAATLARGGLKVILAVAAAGVPAGLTAAATRNGLAEVIQGRISLDQALAPMGGLTNLEIVYPGPDGLLYSELLQSEAARELMVEMRRRADVLVVDVSPMSVNADAQSLAAQFDGVVLVAEQRRTTVDHLTSAMEQLRHVSARVMGGVVARHSTTSGIPAGHEAPQRQTQSAP